MQEAANASKVSADMAALLAANVVLRADVVVLSKQVESSVEVLKVEIHSLGDEVKIELNELKDVLVSQLKAVNKALGEYLIPIPIKKLKWILSITWTNFSTIRILSKLF
jgi:hypothetical protein